MDLGQIISRLTFGNLITLQVANQALGKVVLDVRTLYLETNVCILRSLTCLDYIAWGSSLCRT